MWSLAVATSHSYIKHLTTYDLRKEEPVMWTQSEQKEFIDLYTESLERSGIGKNDIKKCKKSFKSTS